MYMTCSKPRAKQSLATTNMQLRNEIVNWNCTCTAAVEWPSWNTSAWLSFGSVKSPQIESRNARSLTFYSRPVRSRVTNLRGPPGTKTVTYIWRSRGRDCNAATGATSRLPSLAALGNYIRLCRCFISHHVVWWHQYSFLQLGSDKLNVYSEKAQ